ncbi:MAG: DUF2314 domain-containing protein [Fuerstiella sp.]
MKTLYPILILAVTLTGCFDSSHTVAPASHETPSPDAIVSTKDYETQVHINSSVSYTLEDAEERHNEFPDTFWIPPASDRKSLQEGQLVKLMFQIHVDDETQTERMWVIVERNVDHEYIGILDNDPTSTNDIKSGLEVKFGPCHIIEIYE